MAIKKTSAKAEESKITVEETVPAAEEKKAPVKRTAAKKTAAPKKDTVAKEETSVEVYVEYNGVQVPLKEVIENVKTNNVKAAKEIKIYLKPEDNTAYYVADGKESHIKVYFC